MNSGVPFRGGHSWNQEGMFTRPLRPRNHGSGHMQARDSLAALISSLS